MPPRMMFLELVFWTLVGVAWLIMGALAIRWLRWNVQLPLPGRMQDARSVAWRSCQWDIDDAVERAIRRAE